MSSSYISVEPTVIDEDLLKKAVNDQEQVPVDVAEVARKEGIDPLEVASLRLDYKSMISFLTIKIFSRLIIYGPLKISPDYNWIIISLRKLKILDF